MQKRRLRGDVMMIDVKKFNFYLKKDKYYDFEDIKASIEKNVDRQVKKYFDEHKNFHIIDVKTGWFEDEDNYVFSVHVTYEVIPNVVDECLYL